MLIGCSDDTNSPEKAVTGTIDFAEPVDLGSLVSARIKLVDVSIADAPEIVISEQIIEPIDAVPISFSVNYLEEEIDPSRSYSISAAVYGVNDLDVEVRAFITTQTYPVLTQGFGDEANLLVERIN
jgi:uncharacterized lipoprotein YbaY